MDAEKRETQVKLKQDAEKLKEESRLRLEALKRKGNKYIGDVERKAKK